MYKKPKYPLDGVVRHNTLRILFILFSLFTLLMADVGEKTPRPTDALPVLVKAGEPFENRDDFYITRENDLRLAIMSSNGKYIISASGDIIKVWDIESRRLINVFAGHRDYITALALSIDNKYIVSGSDDGGLNLWDIERKKNIKEFEKQENPINSLALSKNGKYIISSSGKNIKIWDKMSGKLLKEFHMNQNIETITISEDSKYIIITSIFGVIEMINIEEGRILKLFDDDNLNKNNDIFTINAITLSQNSNHVFFGFTNGEIGLFDLKTKKYEKLFQGHRKEILSLALSTDNKYLVSASNDNTIKLWNIQNKKLIKTFIGHSSYVHSVNINKNYIMSASNDNTIKLWDINSGQLLKTFIGQREWLYAIAIDSTNRYVITSSYDKKVRVWDIIKKELIYISEKYNNDITSIAFSKNNKYVVLASNGNIVLWDFINKKIISKLKNKKSNIYANYIFVSNNNKYLVVASRFGKMQLWDIVQKKLLNTFQVDKDSLNSIYISNDNKYIISGSKNTKIWDIFNYNLIYSFKENNETIITSVSMTNDNKYVISAYYSGNLKIWDLKQKKLVFEIKKNKPKLDNHINSIAISKDNNYLVLGQSSNSFLVNNENRNIQLWDIRKEKLLYTFHGHNEDIISIKISDDNKYITSLSIDGNIITWDIIKKKSIKNYMLISGKKKNWIVIDNLKEKLWRGDDGTFLLKTREVYKDKNSTAYEITPMYPKEYNLTKEDELRLSVDKKNRLLLNEGRLELTVSIENLGQETYWLKATTQSDYYAIEPNVLSRIGRGEEKKLLLTVHAKLARVNPQPLEHQELNITFTTANGSKFHETVFMGIGYANIHIEKAERSKDGKNLNVLVQNVGNEKLMKADVNLSEPFQADLTTLSNLEANATKTLSFVLPKEYDETKPLKIRFSIANEKEILLNPSGTKIAPAYVWQVDNVTIVLNTMAWYVYALWALGVLVLFGAIYYYKRYKNPLVMKLSENPKELLTLSPKLLTEAQTKLKTIKRWETIVESAEVSQDRFDETLEFFKSTNDQKAELFAKQIEAKDIEKEGEFYRLNLSDGFGLNNIKTFLLYISDESSENIRKKVIELDDKVFVLAHEDEQNSVATLAHDKTNRMVAPTVAELTQLMLSSKGQEQFIEILSHCLAFKDVSPYQINGDVKNASNFFGRVEILRDIISNKNSNYLIVGARQLGKSSIFGALKRHYEGSTKYDCYYITLDETGDVLRALCEEEVLDLPEKSTLGEIVQSIKAQKKKPIFLIDEADMFVKYEKERGYLITSVFRKLSQEGDAIFILAGFWTLYEYVVLDYKSPLKNFGKLITLGGLEEEACRELMIKPMQRIGVSYENESIIEETIKLCGYRANYIAIVCDVLLKGLETNLISKDDIENALDHDDIDKMLRGWGAMSVNKEANRIDRLIVYLTIEKESFRLGDVVELIKEQGLSIDIDRVNESLDRLVLGYVVGKSKGNYVYRVPLLKQRLLEDDIGFNLDGEVEVLRNQT